MISWTYTQPAPSSDNKECKPHGWDTETHTLCLFHTTAGSCEAGVRHCKILFTSRWVVTRQFQELKTKDNRMALWIFEHWQWFFYNHIWPPYMQASLASWPMVFCPYSVSSGQNLNRVCVFLSAAVVLKSPLVPNRVHSSRFLTVSLLKKERKNHLPLSTVVYYVCS